VPNYDKARYDTLKLKAHQHRILLSRIVGQGFERKSDLRGIYAPTITPLALPDGQRNAELMKDLH
jgi:hypothetical protein